MTHFKKGDKVQWNGPGNIIGTVVEKVTSETRVKGHVAKASKEHPEYRVKSDKTGKEAIHRSQELERIT